MNERKDYLSWEEFFMGTAILASMRSKDPNTQVGACIVSADNRILSIGYNGAPNGFCDEKFPWGKGTNALESKRLFVCHAEKNARLNYRGDPKDLVGARLYVTLFPCNDCAQIVIQSGIKEVVYLSDKYADKDSFKASKIMFDECGVTYRQFDMKEEKTFSLKLGK